MSRIDFPILHPHRGAEGGAAAGSVRGASAFQASRAMNHFSSLLLALAMALPGVDVLAAKAALQAEVPPHQWRALRLKRLPKDASLAVRVETPGPINVILVHQKELERFPNPVRPVFAGSAERRLTFSVTVPTAGDYFVILDNRKGAEARDVRVLIEALPAPRPQRKPGRPDEKGLNAT